MLVKRAFTQSWQEQRRTKALAEERKGLDLGDISEVEPINKI